MKRNRLTTAVLLLLACTLMLSSCGVFFDEEKRFIGLDNVISFFEKIPEYFHKTELVYESLGDGTCRVSIVKARRGKTVVIPETSPEGDVVVSIGNSMVRSITGVQMPDTVVEIEEMAFAGCSDLTTLELSNNLQKIGAAAFAITGIQELYIPASVTEIAAFCTEEEETVKVITDPSELAELAGKKEQQLPGVSIGGSIVVYGVGVYRSGDVLYTDDPSYYFKNYVWSLPISEINVLGAFSGCYDLKKIDIDKANPVYHSTGNCIMETESKTVIFANQFSTIPDDGNVTAIASGAFTSCAGLETLTIPTNIQKIEKKVFVFCPELEVINYEGTLAEWGALLGIPADLSYSPTSTDAAVVVHCTDGDSYLY